MGKKWKGLCQTPRKIKGKSPVVSRCGSGVYDETFETFPPTLTGPRPSKYILKYTYSCFITKLSARSLGTLFPGAHSIFIRQMRLTSKSNALTAHSG